VPRQADPRLAVVMGLTEHGFPVISLGRWRCFICGQIGQDGWKSYARHYDTHHLDGRD
jgi:hypothetical protein